MSDTTEFKDGDRVWTLDWEYAPIYGTIHKNPNTEVSEWYIEFDDGEKYAVLCIDMIFHTEK